MTDIENETCKGPLKRPLRGTKRGSKDTKLRKVRIFSYPLIKIKELRTDSLKRCSGEVNVKIPE